MKKTIFLTVVAIAALMVSCKNAPKKSVEEKLAEYTEWSDNLMETYRARAEVLEEDAEALKAFSDSIYDVFVEYNRVTVKENLDNELGIKALKEIYNNMEDDEVEEILSKLTAEVHEADSVFIEKLKAGLSARKGTAEGQMFTDFEIDGVKFSDFVGNGKYVLVDFWASWCGPCRREMPNLRAVYDEFKGENFDMLSVAVWDKLEDTQRAAQEENITWNQIMNAQKVPTDIYGIEGIPHIILFGPDGTILKRNLRGEAIREAVAEALGK